MIYLSHYSAEIQSQVQASIDAGTLGEYILQMHPTAHQIRNDKALYDYTIDLKNKYMKKAKPLSKVTYDDKIRDVNHALGLHTYTTRSHGNKLKTKNEIRIASLFRTMPEGFLRMIVVHELAHIREKEHDKAFYNLCCMMEPDYYQLEFETRLYLTYLDYSEPLYK